MSKALCAAILILFLVASIIIGYFFIELGANRGDAQDDKQYTRAESLVQHLYLEIKCQGHGHPYQTDGTRILLFSGSKALYIDLQPITPGQPICFYEKSELWQDVLVDLNNNRSLVVTSQSAENLTDFQKFISERDGLPPTTLLELLSPDPNFDYKGEEATGRLFGEAIIPFAQRLAK